MYGVTAYTMLLENGPFMKTPGRVSLVQSKKEKKERSSLVPPIVISDCCTRLRLYAHGNARSRCHLLGPMFWNFNP